MKFLILLIIFSSLSSSIDEDLYSLVVMTDTAPYGEIKSLSISEYGNSSIIIDVKTYIFNSKQIEEMTIKYDKTVIQDKFNHSFSIGEEFIFFVRKKHDEFHLVTNTSHLPFLEYSEENLRDIIVAHAHSVEDTIIPEEAEQINKSENNEHYIYVIILIGVGIIGYILYAYKTQKKAQIKNYS